MNDGESQCTNKIASKLEEKNRPAIQKAVEVLGTEVAKELLQETLRIQVRFPVAFAITGN